MISMKTFILISIFLVGLACIYAQIAPGSNAYLPPKENGYNYPGPKTPFKPGRPSPGPSPPGPRPPGPRPPPRGEPGPGHVHMPGMPFDFEYAVNDIETANDYAHKAASNGDEVKGEYRVQLPDGRTQVVRYTADWKTGYHADVSYEGEPRFPQGPGGRPGYKY
ncbi:occludin [Glossina fuscipes]|uniref:Occludin n=2 Tax=Nemorhina TaxID=44051 RepID=A0A9C6DQF7_9MUSC|nr:occludin [Glossina fuscipes]KAI9583025.1 hypothetical protein GQX74_012242 [Glossina fuscipes]